MSLKQYLYRAGLLVSIILIAGIGYRYFFFEKEIPKREGFIHHNIRNSFEGDVIYFSSSSEFSFAPYDKDKSTISELISKESNQNVLPIASGAFHAGSFLRIIEQNKRHFQNKIWIVNLNLRSFGPEWINSPLNNQNEFNMLFYNDYPYLWNRINGVLKVHHPIPESERLWQISKNKFEMEIEDSINVNQWVLNSNPDELKEGNPAIAQKMIERFAFQIDENNPRVKDFEKILDLASILESKVLLVLMPENYQGINKVVGDELSDILDQNTVFLESYFNNKTTLLNCSRILPDTCFYEKFITEHYDFQGRKKLARTISKSLVDK